MERAVEDLLAERGCAAIGVSRTAEPLKGYTMIFPHALNREYCYVVARK